MKEQIINSFTDEYRDEVLNLYEKYLLAKEKNITVFGNSFYSPNVWKWFENNLGNSYVECNGFFDDSERKMISFNNQYKNPFPMKLLKIQNTSKFSTLTHRDFLGAILAVGIERNKIGDLIVDNDICYFPVHKDIVEFILYNLDKIGKVHCKIEECPEDFEIPKIKFKEDIIMVSSLRIDGIVSKITNLSRGKAQSSVEQGKVLIDYTVIKDKSYELKGEERITIRGYGKFILGNIIGNSKSGKIKVIIKKYT